MALQDVSHIKCYKFNNLSNICFVHSQVDDQLFSGHRIVLASTIPYFHAMFTHDMVESKQREITIHGIDSMYVGLMKCKT